MQTFAASRPTCRIAGSCGYLGALSLVVCLSSVPVAAQGRTDEKTVGRILLKIHPPGSSEANIKALALLKQLFESQNVTVYAGTNVSDLSRAHCGHVDANWVAEVARDNQAVTGPKIEKTTELSLPPCPFWRGETNVEIPQDSTVSRQLFFHMGTFGDKTLAQVAKENNRPVEALSDIKAGETVKLPYTTAYRSYTLKTQFVGNPAAVSGLLSQIPGYIGTMPQRKMKLIVAASDADCIAPTNTQEWPFSAAQLRAVLEYNNTKRHHNLRPSVIAVADTGIDNNENRLFLRVNGREIPDNNIDDDENGYIDDYKGANMDTNVTGFPVRDPKYTDSEHGTHVSGLALGGLNDSLLSNLVKQRIEIEEINLVYKDVEASASGPITTFMMPNDFLLDAFKYAAQEPTAQIINLSVENQESSGLEEALEGSSFLVIAAAGNDDGLNIDQNELYPAAATHRERLITVGASDASGSLAKFSNWGKNNVDLAAPGCQVESILPGGQRGKLNGTSQAAPLVSFTAGLLYAEGLTIAQVKDRILLTVDIDHTKLGICVGETGHCVNSEGRLDITTALSIYQDLLTVQKADGAREKLSGRVNTCIPLDGRCYAVRTQLKRMMYDPKTGSCIAWIKSTANRTHKGPCKIDPNSKISFQEAGSPIVQIVPGASIVDLIPGVY